MMPRTDISSQTVEFDTEEELKQYFSKFASKMTKGNVIALFGDLGAGKTTIAREIIQTLCGRETNVPSPTFNLLQTYELPDFTIYHFDLYRLESESEVFELGIEEAFAEHVSIIEWPEIFDRFLPNDTIKIRLSIAESGGRVCKITSI